MFFFMASFNLIIPELNDFITNLGGIGQKGLIITLFTISSGIARPFSGKLADRIGRKKVMIVGMIVTAFVSLLYPLSFSVFFFLLLRFMHGFSAGFFPTGATALLTDILPVNKRGAGMGVWGTFISLGIGAGQGLGSLISKEIGIDNLFMIASGTAVVSGILITSIKETLEVRERFHPSFLKIKMKDVLEPSVLPCAIVMFLSATCSGIVFVLTPDISNFLNIENKGHFFIFYVITTIFVRLAFSGTSDKIGRRKMLLIAMSFLFVSMLLIGFSDDYLSYTLSSVVFGIATGISSPTIFSWTADLSHKDRRGVGSGTMFVALEAGIMFGSLTTLLTYDNTLGSIPIAFCIGSVMALLAVVYLIWHLKNKESLT